MRPGWKTTEFYVTIAGFIIGILAEMGLFTPDQATGLQSVIPQLGGIVVQVAALFGYNWSRATTKATAIIEE